MIRDIHTDLKRGTKSNNSKTSIPSNFCFNKIIRLELTTNSAQMLAAET
ncbi:hypothetical protein PPEP_a1105 [Pseudoalteromonas peptidolytica F12-50-A1]|uniref:Uncharacterized protein n=1 Tax=Pseudoalteromonas peptidolytica F12-50-A1 TaxID=1315280 RepID=A0A8I0T492_9GAMM|nr:hypothetical protein [Pseudoalteromonas peptidolytica F12-50-A1]